VRFCAHISTKHDGERNRRSIPYQLANLDLYKAKSDVGREVKDPAADANN